MVYSTLRLQHTMMQMFTFIIVFSLTLSYGREVDLSDYWDETTPLENPHKGWYHHFPDNHINKYIIAGDADLTEFPGMDHLYMRLSWGYLEPQEGQYNWHVIDQYIEKWTVKGLGIAFRISCRETGSDRIEQQFATPKWVMQAGAQGDYYRYGDKVGVDGPWEPVFDDPIFLEKLENFLKAFAARYDGRPWLRYVDIGSIGDWGEGHCWGGSRTDYNFAQRKKHVDLYLKYFTQSQLVITDDFVYEIKDKKERAHMHQYVVENAITYRDDSPLVNYYVGAFPETFTVRSPEYFEAVFKQMPTVFELEHYSAVKKWGNWTGKPESLMAKHAPGKKGPDFFRGALELIHATYIGYHGYADEWLSENPELTKELLNRCGYWYFPHRLEMAETSQAGQELAITITWEYRGVAPAYHDYDLIFRLQADDSLTVNLPSQNKRWLPKNRYEETYTLKLPKTLPKNEYSLAFKMFSPDAQRSVYLPLQEAICDKAGFYKLCTVRVE